MYVPPTCLANGALASWLQEQSSGAQSCDGWPDRSQKKKLKRYEHISFANCYMYNKCLDKRCSFWKTAYMHQNRQNKLKQVMYYSSMPCTRTYHLSLKPVLFGRLTRDKTLVRRPGAWEALLACVSCLYKCCTVQMRHTMPFEQILLYNGLPLIHYS